jgi:hypothetical protein
VGWRRRRNRVGGGGGRSERLGCARPCGIKRRWTHHHRPRKEEERTFMFFSGEGKENVQLENNNLFTKQLTQKRERKYLFGCGNAVLRPLFQYFLCRKV